MPKGKGSFYEIIPERKCAKCGKTFIMAVEHIYREGAKIYCSWTCYNHRHDKEGVKK
jgi:hypothetical protein